MAVRSQRGQLFPAREMAALRDAMDRVFEANLLRVPWAREEPLTAGLIPLDLYEEGDSLIVKASVPGVRPEDLNVRVCDGAFTLFGEMKPETERNESDDHLRERRYGRFERTVVGPGRRRCHVMRTRDGLVRWLRRGDPVVAPCRGGP